MFSFRDFWFWKRFSALLLSDSHSLMTLAAGVIERFLVTPAKRPSILLGRVLRDAVVLLLQCVLITLVAIPFGLSVNIYGFSLSLVLYALIGITMASISYGFALIYKIEDALAPTLEHNNSACFVAFRNNPSSCTCANLASGHSEDQPILICRQCNAHLVCWEL